MTWPSPKTQNFGKKALTQRFEGLEPGVSLKLDLLFPAMC